MTILQPIEAPKRKTVGLRLSPLTHKWLRIASAQTERSQQDLAEEALKKYLKPILDKEEEA